MRDFSASSYPQNLSTLMQSIRLRLRLCVTDCTRAILLALAILSTGCIGVAYDRTTIEAIENPIPLRAPLDATADFDRWACQPGPSQALRAKSDILLSWGEPSAKELDAEKETWIYAESGRWCGFWIAFGVALPLMLPVCETYDKITFENDLAVSATSRRFVYSGAMLLFAPYYAGSFTRAGKSTENSPRIEKGPNEKLAISCSWRSPRGVSGNGEVVEQSLPDRVSCFSGGKRQWVERSLCD
jgi:hypothetical protein